MQNEMRDRLIELISRADEECKHSLSCKSCSGYGKGAMCMNYHIADKLIKNGVIVPPCEIGSEIYMLVTRHTKSFALEENKKMVMRESQHTIVKKTTLTKSNFFKVIEDFGKTVFLTKEEAEQKLKGGADNGKQ